MPKRSSIKKRPHDINQLAKLVVDLATGDVELPDTEDGKNPAAVMLGRKGGLKGGERKEKSEEKRDKKKKKKQEKKEEQKKKKEEK